MYVLVVVYPILSTVTDTRQPRERPGSFFFTELRAGLATFFAMAYIISVNSIIVSQTGGTCVCPAESMADLCDTNEDYMLCVQEVQRVSESLKM
jgi:AGZA family xanthine/uracil permease-like MFS transporter